MAERLLPCTQPHREEPPRQKAMPAAAGAMRHAAAGAIGRRSEPPQRTQKGGGVPCTGFALPQHAMRGGRGDGRGGHCTWPGYMRPVRARGAAVGPPGLAPGVTRLQMRAVLNAGTSAHARSVCNKWGTVQRTACLVVQRPCGRGAPAPISSWRRCRRRPQHSPPPRPAAPHVAAACPEAWT